MWHVLLFLVVELAAAQFPPPPPPGSGGGCADYNGCPTGSYCYGSGSSGSCDNCNYLSTAECDAINGDCCASGFVDHCMFDPKSCNGASCDATCSFCDFPDACRPGRCKSPNASPQGPISGEALCEGPLRFNQPGCLAYSTCCSWDPTTPSPFGTGAPPGACWSNIGTTPCNQLLCGYTRTDGYTGVPGEDLTCQPWGSEAAIRDACNADPRCLAYNYDTSQTGGGWWCTKTADGLGEAKSGQRLYVKQGCGGISGACCCNEGYYALGSSPGEVPDFSTDPITFSKAFASVCPQEPNGGIATSCAPCTPGCKRCVDGGEYSCLSEDAFYGAGCTPPYIFNDVGGGLGSCSTTPPVPPSCNDTKKNGDETGIDCGGSCPPCSSCALLFRPDGTSCGTSCLPGYYGSQTDNTAACQECSEFKPCPSGTVKNPNATCPGTTVDDAFCGACLSTSNPGCQIEGTECSKDPASLGQFVCLVAAAGYYVEPGSGKPAACSTTCSELGLYRKDDCKNPGATADALCAPCPVDEECQRGSDCAGPNVNVTCAECTVEGFWRPNERGGECRPCSELNRHDFNETSNVDGLCGSCMEEFFGLPGPSNEACTPCIQDCCRCSNDQTCDYDGCCEGKYLSAERMLCSASCLKDQYAPNGTLTCETCEGSFGAGSLTLTELPTSEADCVCGAGYFGFPGGNCTACSPAMWCPGYLYEGRAYGYPYPAAGYWNLNPPSAIMLTCSKKVACPGGEAIFAQLGPDEETADALNSLAVLQCREGHTGQLCANCYKLGENPFDAGNEQSPAFFTNTEGVCEECPPDAGDKYVYGAIALLLCMLLMVYAVLPQDPPEEPDVMMVMPMEGVRKLASKDHRDVASSPGLPPPVIQEDLRLGV